MPPENTENTHNPSKFLHILHFKPEKLATLLFYFSILAFIIGLNFTDVMVGNWYQQFMPNLNNQPLSDIFFIDSLNGWAVTRINTSNDSGYILRTTNRGDNWTIKLKNRNYFQRIQFINANTGFTCGTAQGSGGGGFLYKSTNGGENWFPLTIPNLPNCNDMSVLNEDTIWLVENGIDGSIYRTVDSGASWTIQLSLFGNDIKKIYMYNRNIGFACTSFELYKTMNSGDNWTQISGTAQGNSFIDMYFADSLTGWKTNGDTMKYTTNGGINWVNQVLPYGGIIVTSSILKFTKFSSDTIWGVGGQVYYGGGSPIRGILYRTTNKGQNWLFQVPDTSFNVFNYYHINFINRNNGWAYAVSKGIHTTNGGDTTFISGITKISNEIPKGYKLFQNYPNPFNPKTTIKYQIVNNKYQTKEKVILKIFEITGKEVITLVNEEQTAGVYEVDFSGYGYSSGVYFYSLIIDDKLIDTKKMLLVK